MYRVEVSVMAQNAPLTQLMGTKHVTDSVSVSVERAERLEALAYAIDVLGRLSVPLDARPVSSEQEGRIEDAPGDAPEDALMSVDADVALALTITRNLRPLIAEIAADPGGEWFDNEEYTMRRLQANIVQWVRQR